jgi:hypothetical protein
MQRITPMPFTIYPEMNLIVAQFTGLIDDQDILNWFDDTLAHEAFLKEYDGIVDLREAVFKQNRPEKARFLASYMIERDFTDGKWAVLVSKPMETALLFVYRQNAAQKHPIEIFSTVEATANFLGRDFEAISLTLKE